MLIHDESVNCDVECKNNAVNAIIEQYEKFDLCIDELLESLELKGFPVQDVVDVYAKVIYKIEEDQVIVNKEDEPHSRWEW